MNFKKIPTATMMYTRSQNYKSAHSLLFLKNWFDQNTLKRQFKM